MMRLQSGFKVIFIVLHKRGVLRLFMGVLLCGQPFGSGNHTDGMSVLLHLTVFVEVDEQQVLAVEFRGGFQQSVDFTVQGLLRTPITIWARLLDGESCPSSILSHSSDRSCDSSSSFWSEKMVVSFLASMSS